MLGCSLAIAAWMLSADTWSGPAAMASMMLIRWGVTRSP